MATILPRQLLRRPAARPVSASGQRYLTAASSVATDRSVTEAFRLYDSLKQKFGHMGAVNTKEFGTHNLVDILKAAKRRSDYTWALQAMNLFYNFGIKLRHKDIASRYLAAAMVCKAETEAVELIKLCGTWLERPPDIHLVYAVMGHYIQAEEYLVVREIAKAVREDWRMPVQAPLYALTIDAMLRLPENGVAEAALVHQDARSCGITLPAPLHQRLLNAALSEFAAAEIEEGKLEETHISLLLAALQAANGLIEHGHVLGGASAASLCSTSWLCWYLKGLPQSSISTLEERSAIFVNQHLGGDWARHLRAAMDDFGCHWGFSGRLPVGFFKDLEASDDLDVAELVKSARQRFGRFYPLPAADP